MRGRRAVHCSLRVKLTLAFAAAMGLLLSALALFLYSRFESSLDQSLNQGLHSRTSDVRALVNQADTGLADAGGARISRAGTGFAQVLTPGGGVLDQTPGVLRRSALSARQIASASRRPLLITTAIPGVAGPVRLLATPVLAQGRRLLVVVATSLQSRTAALNDLRAIVLLGGPVALALASLLGYAVSALSLRSVEQMRREASRLSVAEPGHRLRVPPAQDELRRLALTLNEMLDRNDAVVAQERRFVADASHELRSPLAILKMELEDALSGEKSAPELRAAIASSNAEADRISHLARDLLTLAQADGGGLGIERAQLRIDETIRRVRQRFVRRAGSQGRTILASVPSAIIVHADPLRVEQALSNLLDNALRHGQGTIVLSAESGRGFVDIRVADSGPGFPEHYLHAAFERFSRPDQGRTGDGTGLGLSIVASIARAHGGEAYVTNRIGGGADAWIRLPEVGRNSMWPAAGKTPGAPIAESAGAAARRAHDTTRTRRRGAGAQSVRDG